MSYKYLQGPPSQVYFCLGCDDQAPWRADKVQPCPTCKVTDDVTMAYRFQNLTTEADGTVRNVSKEK